ncbi:hypothetical protein ScalyP_jg9856 [Parmales sp. scaly parma]|nr:hypothetical protein ScalyP_jg9856 [Parmales sp. scaly parma]
MVELATTQSPLLGATSFVLTSLITIFSTNLKSISIKEEDGSDEDDGEEFDSSDEECFASSPLVDNWGLADAPYKLVLIVNMSLKMGKGKVCAQCCHAAVGCYKRGRVMKPSGVKWWERTGCAKVAVKCPTENELEEIMAKAKAKGLPYYLVEDAGRTQIAAGSRTVLGLGPAPVSEFEGLSDHLKLM